MKSFLSFFIFSTISLFVVVSPQAISGDDVTKSDTWLQAQLVTTYALNDSLNPFTLEVDVREGVAHLSGTVDTDVERELAVEIAKGVAGIKQVKDNIEVNPEAPGDRKKAADDRSPYRNIEDMTITAKVKTKLMWDRHTNGLDIGVKTDDGVVKLEGKVRDEATGNLAVQIAKNTSGVRTVLNELTVTGGSERVTEPGSSKGEQSQENEGEKGRGEAVGRLAEGVKGKVSRSVQQVGRAANDAWITAKVKTVLMLSKDVEDSDIEVRTENGTVNLQGTVSSEAQAKRIVEITQDVTDVKDVNSTFTIGKSERS